MGKGSGGSAPSPDPQIGKAALENVKLGKEWLGFAREQFDVANDRQTRLDELTQRVGEQQLETQDMANEWARQDRARYEEKFRPLEDRFVKDAQEWDSEERQAKRAAEARADVQTAAAGQRQQAQREMASMGIDPRSGRFQGQQRTTELGAALASAGAQNSARDQVRKEGMALRADAANMGRGLPAQSAAAAGLGLTAGGAALGGASNADASFRANTGIMGQGFQGAMAGNSSMASILNQQHQNQLQAWSANKQAAAQETAGLWGALGSGAGIAAGLMSSKDAKTKKKPVSGALEAIKGLPVEAWEYKDGAKRKAPANVVPPDDRRHIGPYAEDFARETGIGDGKTIPIGDAIGLTMKAVQELDQKVERRLPGKGGRSKREESAA